MNLKMIFSSLIQDIFISNHLLLWIHHKKNLEREKFLLKNNRKLAHKNLRVLFRIIIIIPNKANLSENIH